MPQSDLPRLPRRPTDVPLNEHEERLFGDLEIVFEENLEVADFNRRAAKEAVQLVLTYLDKRGLSGQAMKPLIDVFKALQDVEKGILPELFDPSAASNSGPDGVSKWSRSEGARQIRFYAAACLGALMKTESEENAGKKENAAATVERAVQSWPRHSSGLIKASTIKNWRDDLMQKSKKDPDRQRYERLVSDFSEAPKAKKFLDEVLCKGPPLTGGVRRPKTGSET